MWCACPLLSELKLFEESLKHYRGFQTSIKGFFATSFLKTLSYLSFLALVFYLFLPSIFRIF